MLPYSFSSEITAIDRWLDPRVRLICETNTPVNESMRTATLSSICASDSALIPVIAKIKNIASWIAIPGIQQGVSIQLSANSTDYIVTARVPRERLENVARQPFVTTLKVAQAVAPMLKHARQQSGLLVSGPPELVDKLKHDGEGVVIGIVDDGCDFQHAHFVKQDGQSRLVSIWNQAGKPQQDSPYGYGREYQASEINQALKTADPYAKLNYYPKDASHGTHVMDIAAGHGVGNNSTGIAPKSDIIFVDLLNEVQKVINPNSMGNSVCLVEAVKYIFDKAGNQPCVVNISLGTYGGPHDGTTPVEQAFDALLQGKPNRAIVIAAANSYLEGTHIDGVVLPNQPFEIQWSIPNADETLNVVQIWYSADNEFELEVISPDQQQQKKVGLGLKENILVEHQLMKFMWMYIQHDKADPENKDNVIHLVQNPLPFVKAGIWKLKLIRKKSSRGDGKFHAWIERDQDLILQSRFENSTATHTLGSFATGKKTIVVGSYDAHVQNTKISHFSSSGPTRDGREKPEVIGPGGLVFAARGKSNDQVMAKGGTSMAAPAVAGLIARIFGIAKSKGISLSIDQTRNIVIDSCRPFDGQNGFDPRLGYGKMSAKALLHPLLTLPAPAPNQNKINIFGMANNQRPPFALLGLIPGVNPASDSITSFQQISEQNHTDWKSFAKRLEKLADEQEKARIDFVESSSAGSDDDDQEDEWSDLIKLQGDELVWMHAEMIALITNELNLKSIPMGSSMDQQDFSSIRINANKRKARKANRGQKKTSEPKSINDARKRHAAWTSLADEISKCIKAQWADRKQLLLPQIPRMSDADFILKRDKLASEQAIKLSELNQKFNELLENEPRSESDSSDDNLNLNVVESTTNDTNEIDLLAIAARVTNLETRTSNLAREFFLLKLSLKK